MLWNSDGVFDFLQDSIYSPAIQDGWEAGTEHADYAKTADKTHGFLSLTPLTGATGPPHNNMRTLLPALSEVLPWNPQCLTITAINEAAL
jgi:hypothetical protein